MREKNTDFPDDFQKLLTGCVRKGCLQEGVNAAVPRALGYVCVSAASGEMWRPPGAGEDDNTHDVNRSPCWALTEESSWTG